MQARFRTIRLSGMSTTMRRSIYCKAVKPRPTTRQTPSTTAPTNHRHTPQKTSYFVVGMLPSVTPSLMSTLQTNGISPMQGAKGAFPTAIS